ncbi:MAG: tetratricopeptide repeat protein [Sedimentisphaerales bacterium]|nr:tetratricopeptide repeat protein [Sedimentisphaerales bacterium]
MTQAIRDNAYTSKAELGAARADVLALILSQKFEQAKKSFDKMAANFSSEPDWADTLWWTAERYKWAGKYEDAKELYRKIIRDEPNSPFAERAKLGIPRAEVWFLIRSYNFAEAKKALDKMAADFKGHPDMPETLFQSAEKYRLSENFEGENAVFGRLLEEYPDSKYTREAELGFARTKTLMLIKSGDFDGSEEALDKLVADFNGHSDLQDALYAIARTYGATDRFENERDVYEMIIQKYPDSPSVSKAEALIASRSNVLSLITSGDYDEAEVALDKTIADFNDQPSLPKSVFIIGEEHYNKALKLLNDPNSNSSEDEAKEHLRRAIAVWDRLITKLPSSEYTPQTYYYVAVCYRRLGEYKKAVEYCQKIVDDWPDYEYMQRVKQTMDRCLRALESSTDIYGM